MFPLATRLLWRRSEGLCHQLSKRTLFYSSKKDFSRDFIAFIQQDIDLRPVAIRRWKKQKEWETLIKHHEFNKDRTAFLGSNLAAAHFLIARGGAVRFKGLDKWFEADKDGHVPMEVPNMLQPDYLIEALDASGTAMMYCSFDNLTPLNHLRYLDLSNCENIDDWTLDRLVEYRDTLQYLDLSECDKITEKGIATLHRLPNLRRLKLHNTKNIKHKPLVATMLEEVLPNCVIEGVDFTGEVSQDDLDKELFEKYQHRLEKALEEDLSSSVLNFTVARIKI